MKIKKRTAISACLIAFVLAMIVVLPASFSGITTAQVNQKDTGRLLGNFDARVSGGRTLSDILQRQAGAQARAQALASSMRRAVGMIGGLPSGAKVKHSPVTGAVEMIDNQSGALTASAPGRSGIEIVRSFLRANAAVYGLSASEVEALNFIGESVSRRSGLRMVRFQQVVNGLPVFQSETRAVLTRDGRLVRTIGSLVPGASFAEPIGQTITPAEALVSAMRSVGLVLDPSMVSFTKSNPEGTRATVEANNPQVSDGAESRLVYFPIAPGVLVPAWSQVTFTETGHDWYTLVDAKTGALLWRKNIRSHASTQDARFSVYVQADGKTPADSPAPQSPASVLPGAGTQFPEISRTIVSMFNVQDLTASPNGWINDGGNTTTGNNVDAYVDRVAPNGPDTGTIDLDGRPIGNPDPNGNNRDFFGTTPRDYTYNPAPQGGNPDAGDTPTGTATAQINFRRGAVTQLFYITNWYHDQLFNLGFDEAAGNFQQTNFSGMGLGNDRVRAEVQDSSSTNNANFSTPPDGSAPRMQMFRFTFPNPDRDASLDAEIVIHELTHGLSNRLIGNADGLVWSPGQGMGEGWSDFYALSLLNNTNADDPDGSYASGGYATYRLGGLTDNYLYGIRRFPYSTNNSVNPLTWGDADSVTANMAGGIAQSPLGFEFNGALEVHNVGEIWALTLWEMRSRIINDPNGANGDVPTGNLTALQIVTDALKLTPNNPSFTEARDALIEADGATNNFANEQSIWEAFADRGLGYKAIAPLGIVGISNIGNLGVGESFSVPFLDAASVAVDDSDGNNNGSIDPGEPIELTVKLNNPWNHASKGVASATAVLTSSTPGVTIINANSAYGAIAAQASVDGTPFRVLLSPSVTCGQALDFDVVTTSSLGTTTTSFRLRVGTPSGTGAPITYTKTVSPGLAIPDGDFVGVNDSLAITDDFEIADIDFRVDNLTHTFTGDLTIMLRAPNGYGADLIWLREALFVGGGNGDNFVNTVIDDQATDDLNQSLASDAPFTGSWLPAFNSPIWLLFGDPAIFPDPVGQLSRLNGQSTKGTWTVHITDQFNIDSGTLNSWSLIVTPVAYTCAPFTCPSPTITCPSNVVQTLPPNTCQMAVTFPDPTVSSNCSIVNTPVCTPASGSTFQRGVTTVTCTVTDSLGNSNSCSFTVTVNDAQAPMISCPANITAVTGAPNATSKVVTFAAPVASDNCPGVTTVCVPASGSAFPVGTTTVTCTATDASGNTASCSFTVTVFDVCLQDNVSPGKVLLFNSFTGEYRFCCGNLTLTGRGIVTKLAGNITLQHNAPDRRVSGKVSTATRNGNASLQFPAGTTICTISDSDIRDNSCICGTGGIGL